MRSRFGPVSRTLVLSVALPLIVVQVLLRRDVPAVTALAISAIFPFADAVLDLVRARRLAPIPLLSLAGIVVGIGLAFLSNNPSFAIARESVVTGLVALVFLGSLVTAKPLMFRLAREFAATSNPAEAARLDALWAREGFRHAMRLMTAVWGCGLLVEAALRVLVAFSLPPATATIVAPGLAIAVFAALISWSVLYVRRLERGAPRPA